MRNRGVCDWSGYPVELPSSESEFPTQPSRAGQSALSGAAYGARGGRPVLPGEGEEDCSDRSRCVFTNVTGFMYDILAHWYMFNMTQCLTLSHILCFLSHVLLEPLTGLMVPVHPNQAQMYVWATLCGQPCNKTFPCLLHNVKGCNSLLLFVGSHARCSLATVLRSEFRGLRRATTRILDFPFVTLAPARSDRSPINGSRRAVRIRPCP